MSKNQLFVEQRDQGDYAVRRPNSQRASAICETQAEAIDRARDLGPDAQILVEWGRRALVDKPDQWRKPRRSPPGGSVNGRP
jgi:hypothetical protein